VLDLHDAPTGVLPSPNAYGGTAWIAVGQLDGDLSEAMSTDLLPEASANLPGRESLRNPGADRSRQWDVFFPGGARMCASVLPVPVPLMSYRPFTQTP
jgi:hypothetical protein